MTKLLILGIRMDRGGTERALISFLEALDPSQFQVDLLLAQQEGPLMKEIPPHITLLPPMKNGILFTMSRRNAVSVFRKLNFQGKATFFSRHPSLLSDLLLRKPGAGERLFITLMKESCRLFSEEYPGKTYDAALAFSGDRTMFYLCDRVCCPKRIAWLHFDYRYPARDDEIYASYFRRCQAVLSVSEACTALLTERFPSLSDRFHTFYNRLPQENIRTMAEAGASFHDPLYSGFRILSVMRICHQKGCDLIPHVLKRLKDAGISARWYLAGDGEQKDVKALRRKADVLGVADRLVLLGGVGNPYPLMKACDLFVLPSRYEGMPITVEEAKLLGVPILCTDYLSAREQLFGGSLGGICQFSVSSLASAIATLLLHPELRNRYRKHLARLAPRQQDVNEELLRLLAYC